MTTATSTALALPDIANEALEHAQGTLDWVGMSNIHQPVLIAQGGVETRTTARVDVHVDLCDAHAKGIHMSRLYLELDAHARDRRLSPASVKMLLNTLHQSHRDLSASARVCFSFDHCVRRNALRSDNAGWSNYPVVVEATLENGAIALDLSVDVVYSSTCPCSAALARQLIQGAFEDAFHGSEQLSFETVRAWLGTEDGIVATPHSQRSVASIRVRLNDGAAEFPIETLIDTAERALATPVQTAVKREDEQEFALRNGQNLMFCEDAARRLKRTLDRDARFADFHVRIEHQESLHAHDATAVATKGVPGGFGRRL